MTFQAPAIDPTAGHALSYQWEIVSDPTGRASILSGATSSTVEVKFPWVSATSDNHIGESIILKVTVNHADLTNGDNPISREFQARIDRVNQPPDPVIDVYPVSSATNRIPEGEGVSLSSDNSIDPDNSGARHEWTAQTVSGTLSRPLTLFGSEGNSSGFTIPLLTTATAEVMVTLTLLDGLHTVTETLRVYLKKADASSTNSAPTVTVTTPVNVLVGEAIPLFASITDPEDACSFTWTFVQGSATTITPVVVTVKGTPPYQWNVSGSHPALPEGTYQFKLRATENRTGGQSTEKTITVNVTQTGGGGGGGSATPENGGAADWVPTTSGCTGNTPPTVSIAPTADQFKPLYTGGQTVVITVTATDTSEAQLAAPPALPSTGARIFWMDYGELTALGVNNVQAGKNQVSATDRTTSTATLTFTAPNTTATAHITFRAVDIHQCERSITFAVAFKPASANTPPTARIKYKIDSGTLATPTGPVAVTTNTAHTITLDGTGSTDPGGAIASYQWALTGASGLTGATSSTASFVVPVGFAGSATVSLTVRDSAQVSNSTSMTFNFTAASATAPIARIKYKVGTSGTLAEAPSSITLNLTGSQSVIFDGGTSSDPQAGILTYAWTKDQSQLTGSATAVGGTASQSYTVNFSASARGTVVITLTVKDPTNETGTASVVLNVQGPPPVARIKYGVGSDPLTATTPPPPIATDTAKVINLDGSTSSVEGGTIASFTWSTSDTPGVTLTGETTATPTLTIAAGTLGTVTVSLTVKDSANQENTVQITFEMVEKVEIPALYFPQIGMGPLGNGQELKTVMLIINDTDTDANEVIIEFFAQDGSPLNPLVDGEAGESEPLIIKSMTSKRLTFTNSEIQVGWARVTSDAKLFGLVRYQMVDMQTQEMVREIGLFSSPPARKVVTFFDRAEHIALAVANPGESPAKVQVKIVDTEEGETPDVAWKVLPSIGPSGLGPNKHAAHSLIQSDLPPWANQGSLVIESDNEVVVTVLRTTSGGAAFSTLPISVTR